VNYVVAAWVSCGVLLAAYALRTVRRERTLRRALSAEDRRWR